MNNKEKISGIYKWINKVNLKYYVGNSEDIISRRNNHKSDLQRGVHKNSNLQLAWNTDHEENFDFVIIEKDIDINQLLKVEQKYLNVAKLEKDKCYNIAFVASSPMLGKKHTEETKKKLSQIAKQTYSNGRIHWATGKRFTKEHRKNMSDGRIKNDIERPLKQNKPHHKQHSKRMSGKNNPSYNPSIYTFYNEKTQEKFIGTCYDFSKKFDIDRHIPPKLVNKTRGQMHGWTILE